MIIGIDASRTNAAKKTGTEYYSASLIEWLSKIDNHFIRKGRENQYILYSSAPLTGDLVSLRTNFTSKVIPARRMWTHFKLSWRMIVDKPDVLFIPAHVIPIIHPKKTVITIHDVAFNYFPKVYSAKARNYLEWSTKYAVKKAAKIIAISNSTKSDLIKFYKASPDKIEVIHNGYDELFLSTKPDPRVLEKMKERLGIRKDFLLFIGRIEGRKNILNIIRAFEAVRRENHGLQLVIAGKSGFGSMEIFKEIERSEYSQDIITPGYVSEEESIYLMHSAKIFVFATLYEGFGIPILEAMASGTPVITSTRSSMPEITGDAAMLVDPLKPIDIADAIINLIENENLRKELIEKGKIRIKSFSWEKCAQETLNVFEKLK